MDPSAPLEQGVQAKEKKKIHFSVPTIPPTQLDPRQVEMIRRRRPTPATLFRVAEHPSPEDDITTHQWVVGENGVLKPRRVNPSVYQPPSLKAVQRMAEAHMQTLGTCPPLEDPSEGDESEDYLCLREEGEEGSEENEESPTHGAGQMETGSVDSQSERMLRTEDGAELNQGSERGNESEDDEQEDEDTEARRMGSD